MLRIKTILIAMLPFVLVSSMSHAFCFEEAGAMYSISPDLLKAVAKGESNMDPAAIHWNDGGRGQFSVGLMQIHSSWYKIIGPDLWMQLGDPCTNVKIGAWILAQCIRQHGYNWSAVGCYNAKTPNKMAVYAQKVSNILQYSSKKPGGNNN